MLAPTVGTDTLSAAFRRGEQVARDLLGTTGGAMDEEAPQQQVRQPAQGEAAGNGQPEKKPGGQPQSTHLKAFYNNPPEGCHWEKIIDPEDGSVRCSVPDRRQVARQR